MGKTYAPGLADLYLEEFDEKATTGFRIKPLLFHRFLDDIFFVWIGTMEELLEFGVYLNGLIEGIHVTLNSSTLSVDFLDTTVYKSVDDVLLTKVFFKATDTHQLLHRASFHPRHTAKGVLKSQILRFKRISSSKEDFDEACHILFSSLRRRGYSASLMRKMKRDIWNDNKIIVANDTRKLLPIVIPYNDVGTALATRWKKLIASNSMFDSFRLVTAYTVARNIRKTLVRSKLVAPLQNVDQPRSHQPHHGCRRCNSNHCKVCRHITQGVHFTSTHNRKTFSIIGNITCKTSNLVYLITCGNCSLQYVGETSRTLAERITDHKSNIRLRKNTPVALHFNTAGHSIKDLTITGIESFDGGDHERKIKESTWQHLLQTTHPHGLNNLKGSHL